MKKIVLTICVLFTLALAGSLANKTKVDIKAPAEIKAGTEITLVLNVTHKGNSKGHHTDWVWLKVNGKEVQRWEFSKTALPKAENFTIEYKIEVTDDLQIESSGHCNIHGSTGIAKTTVKALK